MEFLGEVVKKKELTGEENLLELVSKFKEERALISEDSFPVMKKDLKRSIIDHQRNLQKTITRISGDIHLNTDSSRFKESLDFLLENYICSEFGMKYDKLSSELFSLKRIIPYKVDDKNLKIKIPLFASVNLYADGDWIFKDEITEGNGYSSKIYKINLTSKRPPISREVKEKARIAKADYMEIFSRALRKPIVGDLLNRDSYFGNFNINIKWIPKPSELNIEVKVIDRDPILIAHVCNRNYLISSWNVEGEEPYEHYIREFSEGKLKISAGKLKI